MTEMPKYVDADGPMFPYPEDDIFDGSRIEKFSSAGDKVTLVLADGRQGTYTSNTPMLDRWKLISQN